MCKSAQRRRCNHIPAKCKTFFFNKINQKQILNKKHMINNVYTQKHQKPIIARKKFWKQLFVHKIHQKTFFSQKMIKKLLSLKKA